MYFFHFVKNVDYIMSSSAFHIFFFIEMGKM